MTMGGEQLRARLIRSLPDRAGQNGQVLVLFALALVFVLIPAVGLGIDGGRVFEERRAAQIAVDQAVIAATRAACVPGGGDPVTKGRQAADRNGYNNGLLTAEGGNTVTIERPDPTNKPYMWTATIHSRIHATFSRIIGAAFSKFDVEVTATADGANCGAITGGPGAGPIFAGGSTCPGGSLNNIQISGNDHDVIGLTQTNGNFYLSGGNNDFNNSPGPAVKYGGAFNGGDGSNMYAATPEPITPPPPDPPPWPAGWGPDAMTGAAGDAMWQAYRDAPVGTVRQNADYTQMVTTVTANGLYYTEHVNGMDIGSIGPLVTSLRLVSRNGPIKLPTDLSSSELVGRTFTYYNDASLPKQNIIIMSGFTHSQPCDQFAIEKSGNRGLFKGIFWAPKAMVRWSGNEASLEGCIISHAFQMNGNLHNLTQDMTICGAGGASSSPQISLLK